MTEQKADEVLSTAGRLLRSLADASLDAIYIKDRNSRWLFANPALERIAGKSVKELLGKTDAEIYSNLEVGQTILANDKKIMESGKSETFEEFVDLPDGRHFFISVKSPRFDEKGIINGLLGISHDITNRKKREEELRESQKKYKDLIETTNDFVWEMDPSGRFTYCSPQMEKLWMLRPEEMIGKTPFDQMPAGAKEEGIRFYQSLVASKKSFSGLQVPSLNGEGKLIFIELSGVPFFDDRGELLGYRGITRDITVRKKAEEQTAFAAKLLENINEGAIGSDQNYVINYWNKAAERVLGWKAEEVIGKAARDVLQTQVPTTSREKEIEKMLADGRYEGEVLYRHKTGPYLPTYVRSTVLKDENGEMKGTITTFTDITERKKAEEKLRISESRYHSLFSNMVDGFAYCQMIFDEKGKPLDFVYLEVNDAFEHLTGLRRENVVGRKVSEAIPGTREANPEMFEIYGRAAKTGIPERFELFFKPLSIWLDIAVYSPKTEFFVAVFSDITGRKNAEENLKKLNDELEKRVQERTVEVSTERQRLYNVLETLPSYVILLDRDYHVRFANKIFRESFGEDHGRPCYEYLFGKDHECENCETYKVYKENKPQQWYWTGPNGQDYDIYDFPFKETDGSTLILEMGIDITERKKAEAAVQQERKRFYDVLETLPAMICLISPNYRIVFANRSFRERFGESRGRPCYEYCFGQTEPCTFCESLIPLKTGQPHHWEVNCPDGSVVEAHDYPFTDIDGSKLVLEMDIDITARKKAEAEAIESAKRLKDSERLAAIGATAGMVGHDIRNPLQAIGNDVFLLRSDIESLPKGRRKKDLDESLTSIEQNVQYINKIVQDLQDYAKPLKPINREVDVQTMFEDVLFKNGVPKNIEASCQVDKNAKKILTDHEILKRILSNLVSNAVQAMTEGGKLSMHAIQDQENTIITVEDTGVGIPEETRSKLFTPLFTTKSKGQGFGLAVVKRMTEALDGTIEFKSEVGKGTKFILRLPLPIRNKQ